MGSERGGNLRTRGRRPPPINLSSPQEDSTTEKAVMPKLNVASRRSSILIQQCTEIVPGNVFLGNESDANNQQLISQLGITAIVSLNPVCLQPDILRSLDAWLYQPVKDQSDQQILNVLDTVVEFMRNHRRVLVHCQHGVSRSSTAVMAYLIKTKGITHGEAFELVKEKRDIIDPNFGFMSQLKMYEEKQKSSVPVEKAPSLYQQILRFFDF